MFKNLRAEMARMDNMSGRAVADAIGITAQAFYDKMSGRSEFKRSEMFKIQELFFKDLTIDYLFKLDDPKPLVTEKDFKDTVAELIDFQKRMKGEK